MVSLTFLLNFLATDFFLYQCFNCSKIYHNSGIFQLKRNFYVLIILIKLFSNFMMVKVKVMIYFSVQLELRCSASDSDKE